MGLNAYSKTDVPRNCYNTQLVEKLEFQTSPNLRPVGIRLNKWMDAKRGAKGQIPIAIQLSRDLQRRIKTKRMLKLKTRPVTVLFVDRVIQLSYPAGKLPGAQ